MATIQFYGHEDVNTPRQIFKCPEIPVVFKKFWELKIEISIPYIFFFVYIVVLC